MKKIIQAAVLATVLFSAAGHSSSILGAGAQPCRAWTADTEEETPLRYFYYQWLLGYMSGVASMVDKVDVLNGRDKYGLTGWMDNYCKDNPLNAIQNGADSLVPLLIKMQAKK